MSSVKVVLYKMKGCGFCDNMLPEWERFVEMAKEKGIVTKMYTHHRDGSGDSEAEAETKDKGITSWPTIHMYKLIDVDIKGKKSKCFDDVNQILDYNGNRTAEDFLEAAENLVKQERKPYQDGGAVIVSQMRDLTLPKDPETLKYYLKYRKYKKRCEQLEKKLAEIKKN